MSSRPSGFRLGAEAALLLALGLSPACAVGEGASASTSACNSLSYSARGPARADYLPCAKEMMTVLEELDAKSVAAFQGDKGARSEGQQALRKLNALLRAAGDRKLLDRWGDPALTDFNVDVNNAVTRYRVFYMLPILPEPHPFAAKTRKAASDELQGGTRNYQEARSSYRRIGGR